MKILLSSYAFSPSVGGIESVSASLAAEFVAAGHEVKIITQTPGPDPRPWPFEIVRRPSLGQVHALVRWCDVFFQNNISLQCLPPLLVCRRPWVVTHQTWITRVDGSQGWQDRLKRWLLRLATNISISRAVAASVPVPSEVIPNPYEARLFRRLDEVKRDADLVCLARLVSDKGVDLLLEALALLARQDGLRPRLTVIGRGPEEEKLKGLASTLGIDAQVTFAGPKSGEELVRELNRHRIMVIPSRWAEPFGVVALEGIACGCLLVGSEGGGLPDAIGPCGLLFPNGDAAALAAKLRTLLHDEGLAGRLRAGAPAHLEQHTARSIARRYLDRFQSLVR